MFNLDSMQGTLANSDLMEKAFDLVNDGVLFLNTNQEITKMNKSAEILLNMTSHLAMGRSITDLLTSSKAAHLIAVVRELTTKSHAMLLQTNLTVISGQTDSSIPKEQKVNINFYASKLVDSNKRTFAYCLVLQPILWILIFTF